jgi:hypothetical protein
MVHATAVEGFGAAKLTLNVLDGARGMAFIEAAVKASRNDGAWVSASLG